MFYQINVKRTLSASLRLYNQLHQKISFSLSAVLQTTPDQLYKGYEISSWICRQKARDAVTARFSVDTLVRVNVRSHLLIYIITYCNTPLHQRRNWPQDPNLFLMSYPNHTRTELKRTEPKRTRIARPDIQLWLTTYFSQKFPRKTLQLFTCHQQPLETWRALQNWKMLLLMHMVDARVVITFKQ